MISSITPNRNIWDSIAIVIALDFLHNDFEITTVTILEPGDKMINKIQHILTSVKAKFISKCATGVIGDLAMMFKDQNLTKKSKQQKQVLQLQKARTLRKRLHITRSAQKKQATRVIKVQLSANKTKSRQYCSFSK